MKRHIRLDGMKINDGDGDVSKFKDVNLDATDLSTIVGGFATGLFSIDDSRMADVQIVNELSVPLNWWNDRADSGDYVDVKEEIGKGKKDPTVSGAPDSIINEKSEELIGIGSDGAGAVGCLIYRVDKTDYYILMYYANPKTTSNRVHCRIAYAPNWSKTREDVKDEITETIFKIFDNLGKNSEDNSVEVFGMGLKIHASYGYDSGNLTATFTIGLDDRGEDAKTFVIGASSHKLLYLESIFSYGKYSDNVASAFPGVSFLCYCDKDVFDEPYIATAFSQTTKKDSKTGHIHRVFEVAGVPYTLYLRFRDFSGAVKLYDEKTEWHLNDVNGDEKYSFYSYEEGQYMWDNDGEPYVTSNGNPNNNDALWEFIDITYKPS